MAKEHSKRAPPTASDDEACRNLMPWKISHKCRTSDGWTLHIVRTVLPTSSTAIRRRRPVVLVPGLGASGIDFDLASGASLVDWLAARGWDVWTASLRGMGQSDKPSVMAGRSNWWRVDDNVELDLPAILRHVCNMTGCSQVHAIGHSMGGMILTRALALADETAALLKSCIMVGSSCFLKGSWWEVLDNAMAAAGLMWMVPAKATLRLYSSLAFTRYGNRFTDMLYFWPSNTDPVLGRDLLARNFSSISPGVILQMRTAFGPRGLLSARLPALKAEEEREAAEVMGEGAPAAAAAQGKAGTAREATGKVMSEEAATATAVVAAATMALSGPSVASAEVVAAEARSQVPESSGRREGFPPEQPGSRSNDTSTNSSASSDSLPFSSHLPSDSGRTGASAFQPFPPSSSRSRGSSNTGARSGARPVAFAEPELLAKVTTPVMLICGDRDFMCPVAGARHMYELFGSTDKLFVELGPKPSGSRHHYGHFDILMGRHVEEEVFPRLCSWLERQDEDRPKHQTSNAGLRSTNTDLSTVETLQQESVLLHDGGEEAALVSGGVDAWQQQGAPAEVPFLASKL